MGAREAERGQCRPSKEVGRGKDWEEKSPLAVTVWGSARSVEQFLCMWGRHRVDGQEVETGSGDPSGNAG